MAFLPCHLEGCPIAILVVSRFVNKEILVINWIFNDVYLHTHIYIYIYIFTHIYNLYIQWVNVQLYIHNRGLLSVTLCKHNSG